MGALQLALIVIKKSKKSKIKASVIVFGESANQAAVLPKKLHEFALLTVGQPQPLAFHIFNSNFHHWAVISIKLLVK